MRYSIDGVSLAYEEAGSGPAVLLVHGYPLNRNMWSPQRAALAGAGFRVITPDLRGFGESEAPAEGYSMARFADDLIALLDRLGIRRAAVGGMSMGGYVLLNLLERHPERLVAAMFLVTRAGADDDAGRSKRTIMAEQALAGQRGVVEETFADLLFAEQTLEENPQLVDRVTSWMRQTDPQGLAGGMLAMRDRPDYTERLPGFRIPALVIGAEKDRAVPVEQSRVLAAGIPGARRCLITGAGHMVNLERPDAFNECLLEFLQGLRL
ncbi:alpha/beta hydrolase [Desulfuromonas versatilis]|uniref:Alpha/beta hydrolase n=1 Tax=Desulfuromonas versatilis TaxID=2802975 RepID=A0ABM8HTL0_9BACT|nr:alpha/beta fold hydrolase [Desulfuromonas versatilis]BCR03804.1 alpha/beta hydrolase [Desulfuromonas versatilis]